MLHKITDLTAVDNDFAKTARKNMNIVFNFSREGENLAVQADCPAVAKSLFTTFALEDHSSLLSATQFGLQVYPVEDRHLSYML